MVLIRKKTAVGCLSVSLELNAILATVKRIGNLRNHSMVIYYDSCCVLQVNKSLNSSHPVVKEAQDCLALISARNWVLVYVGISGNEQADQRARQLPLSSMILVFPSHIPT